MGEVLLAGEEPDERPSPARGRVTEGAAQRGVGGFEGVDDASLGGRPAHLELHLPTGASQVSQVVGEQDSDHGSVCTSTDRTRGRSRTMAVHDFPESADP